VTLTLLKLFSQNLSQSSASSQRTSYNDFSNLSQVRPIVEFINLVKVCFFYAQTCFEFFYAQIKNTYCIILYFMCIICVRKHIASLFVKQLIKFNPNQFGWYYESCTKCSKTSMLNGASYKCTCRSYKCTCRSDA
jgi:hypothetical protein